MKKASIMGLALVLVLAASAFASAANYVGGGLGIKAAADASDAKGGIIGALSLDFDVMEKLTLSANGYIEFKQKVEEEPPATDAAFTMPKFEEPTYLGGRLRQVCTDQLRCAEARRGCGSQLQQRIHRPKRGRRIWDRRSCC